MKKKILVGGSIILAIFAVFFILRFSLFKEKTPAVIQTFNLEKTDLLDSVLVSGTVKSSRSENVYSKTSNYPISEVYFEVGDKVKAGDVLAKLDTTSLRLDIKQTQLNIQNAEISLNNEDTANQFNIQNAQKNMELVTLELENAQINLDQIKLLEESGVASQDELEKAESALKKAQISYENAQASLENIENKNTATLMNNLEMQKVTLEKQRKALEDAQIIAPIDGTLTMVNAKENSMATGLLFVIEDTENLIVSTAIGEYDIGLIELDQEVIIKTDTTGDKEFLGYVSKLAPTAIKDASGNTASSSNVLFDTEITMKDTDENIKIGMNVRLTVKLNEKKDVFAVPYDIVFSDPDGSQCIYVLETTEVEGEQQSNNRKIQVQTGMETDMYVEITSDELKPDMKVLMNKADDSND